ncbi:MAG: hypothetical protein M1833_005244 [Piccolia ochrophora]|nr:MAG: hypothetical protein M1833_005244 [Piccolia ochrophora]
MPEVDEVRARMLAHFHGFDDAAQGERWEQLWKTGDFLPWDKGFASPALEDLLKDRADLLGSPTLEGDATERSTDAERAPRRKRALVPGCGRGYDVHLLASYGYDAYGLEISEAAVESCREYARGHGEEYPVRDRVVGRGVVRFVLGDFFKDDWFGEIEGAASFQLCYDYTFFCALPPSLRPAWSRRYAQLLSPDPGSRLICLEFPTAKPPESKGPPFASPPEVWLAHLSRPGDEIRYDAEGRLVDKEPHGSNSVGFDRITHFQPERTHEIGKGTDWMSVWKHHQGS